MLKAQTILVLKGRTDEGGSRPGERVREVWERCDIPKIPRVLKVKGRGAALSIRKVQLGAGMAGDKECHLRDQGSHMKAYKGTLNLPTWPDPHSHSSSLFLEISSDE